MTTHTCNCQGGKLPSNHDILSTTKQALVEKSHCEYWLQVSAQRLLKVECAEEQHVPDMAKLEGCIDKVHRIG